MIGAGVGPRQIGPVCGGHVDGVVAASSLRRQGAIDATMVRGRSLERRDSDTATDNSWGVKPARVRSPPLLAPSTNVIVAKLSNNCLEPSAFLAKAHAVLACVRVDESDLVVKDAVSYDFLGVEARGAVLLCDLGRHRVEEFRGR